jgi:hypothetical protein
MKLDMSTYEPFGLEAIETASRDEIAALQTRRIKRTLESVYENVPAYRKKFDGAGVTPADFRRLEDLSKFPFTTKQDLRESYPFGMFAVPRDRIAPTWLRGRCAQAAPALACLSILPSATAFSRAASACTMVRSGWAVGWSRWRAG